MITVLISIMLIKKLVGSRTMFWNLDARDPNAALSLAAEICIHTIHRTRSPSSANKSALPIYSLIIIALIFITLINAVNVKKGRN